MIKLHLHFAMANHPDIGVKAGEELGHLYSDDNNLVELTKAAISVGISSAWIQSESTGITHYDLWHSPLRRAKILFKVVDDCTLFDDLVKLRNTCRDI